MVLRDPLLLISASASSSDSADRCANRRNSLALLGLRYEGEVRVVAESPQYAGGDEICQQAMRELRQEMKLAYAKYDVQLDIKEGALRFDNGDDRVISRDAVCLTLSQGQTRSKERRKCEGRTSVTCSAQMFNLYSPGCGHASC